MYCIGIDEHKNSGTPRPSANRATILFMIVGFVLLVVLILLIRPAEKILFHAVLVGAIMTVANYLIAILALRLGFWTVRGAWLILGYPLSMVLGWLFLITGFCLVFNWLHFWWSRSVYVALSGFGGSMWDLNMDTRAGVLVVGRAKRWQIILYWLALSIITALLFLISTPLQSV